MCRFSVLSLRRSFNIISTKTTFFPHYLNINYQKLLKDTNTNE